jgi:Rrf2 family transcriptional regulator, iron-sulfur cluster assembly transcription factor
MFSNSCEYGLRATIYLATVADSGPFVSIGTISEGLDISFHFLTKTFHKMTKAGLLESQRGGVRLAQAPEAIGLKDIVLAIDGEALFTECILGLSGCGEREPCPIHETWTAERGRIATMLADATFRDLADDPEAGGSRLRARLESI